MHNRKSVGGGGGCSCSLVRLLETTPPIEQPGWGRRVKGQSKLTLLQTINGVCSGDLAQMPGPRFEVVTSLLGAKSLSVPGMLVVLTVSGTIAYRCRQFG